MPFQHPVSRPGMHRAQIKGRCPLANLPYLRSHNDASKQHYVTILGCSPESLTKAVYAGSSSRSMWAQRTAASRMPFWIQAKSQRYKASRGSSPRPRLCLTLIGVTLKVSRAGACRRRQQDTVYRVLRSEWYSSCLWCRGAAGSHHRASRGRAMGQTRVVRVQPWPPSVWV